MSFAILCSAVSGGGGGGGAFASFSYDHSLGGWVHSADGAVVGEDFAAVTAACAEQRYRPSLLLYQVHPSQF